MAPFIGPKKEKVLRILRSPDCARRLPMWIGMMSPKAMIRLHEGRFQLVPLVLDEDAAAAEGDRRIARGEAWLPEMTWAFLQPGAPAIDCGTLDEFLGALEALDWRSYEDFPLPPVPTPRR